MRRLAALWKGNRWQRFWENEQTDSTKDGYLPQHFWKVLVSVPDYLPGGDRAEYLIVTLAQNPWYASNWKRIYCRIWRAKDAHTELLSDGNEAGFRGG